MYVIIFVNKKHFRYTFIINAEKIHWLNNRMIKCTDFFPNASK